MHPIKLTLSILILLAAAPYGTASAKLTLDQNEQGITISGLPSKAPTSFATVIELKY